jgi:ABC-2 type transport system ATP-binding protein
MGRCGLADVRTRIIDHLSKGYRQRVGLAEALLHNPPILILDEPTVGLDPNQIRQVRGLIRDLGREHTIILSSHILPEVEQICERVVIIAKGRIVAEDRTAALRDALGGGARLEVEIQAQGPGRASVPGVLAALGEVPGVVAAKEAEAVAGDTSVRASVECAAGRDPREEIFRLAVARGWVLLGLTRRQLSLEDVFVDLTTRDDDAGADAPSGPLESPGRDEKSALDPPGDDRDGASGSGGDKNGSVPEESR